MKLNDQQEKAAEHYLGACLVSACPGSGKSRCIVERTVRLINKGVAPSQILSITFTNKAANELKERVAKRVGTVAEQMTVSTFHKLCSTILRNYGSSLGYSRYMSILDEDGQIDIMAQIARQQGNEFTKPQLRKLCSIVNDSRENRQDEGELCKRLDKENINYKDIATEYLKRLPNMNACDFSGLLSETVRLLETNNDVLKRIQNRWSFLMCDEAQDTNHIQFFLLELIFSHTNNIFIVGDADQLLYGWRGAKIANIIDFQKRHKNAQIIPLGKNYRCTPQIVKASSRLIKHNWNRIDVPFETDNPDGPNIVCRAFIDDREEANATAKAIKNLVDTGKCKYSDVAVLYRMNAMSRAIEMAMVQAQIPHTVIGAFSFFDRKEIKDCIAMLRFISNPHDGISFHRIANKPKRALGDSTIGRIETYASQNNCSILGACFNMAFTSDGVKEGLHTIKQAFDWKWEGEPIGKILAHIIKELKYEEYLQEDPETSLERMENVQEFINDAARYSEEHGHDLAGYLEHLALTSGSDKVPDENSVSLLSVHASKGLEFKAVFVIGSEQNIFPHKRAVEESDDGIESERNCFYVALTRCKYYLSVSYCKRRQSAYAAKSGKFSFQGSNPSQFLFEAGLLKHIPIKERS